MPKSFEAVIFDFDGTLYDNYKISRHLISSHPFHLLKMGADRKIRKHLKGIDFNNGQEFFLEYYKELAEQSHTSFKKAKNWYENKYMAFMIKILKKNYKCQPGIPELFKYLDENNIKTAILSDYNFVPERMKAINIDPSICKHLYSSVELGGLKPAKGPFIKVAQALGVSPEKILVVGDRNDTDGQGAKNCGMQFVQIKIQATKEKAEDVNHPLLSWNEFCEFIKQD